MLQCSGFFCPRYSYNSNVAENNANNVKRDNSMFKKITISAVVALPFPFLIILAGSRLDVFASEKSAIEFLKTDNGIAFYAAAFFMFLVASVIASLFFDSEARSSNTQVSNDESDSGVDFEGTGAEFGTVKWFNVNKGFGFITTDDGHDIFVHFRSINGRGRRSLRQGQSVRFDTSMGEKGKQADNVSVVK